MPSKETQKIITDLRAKAVSQNQEKPFLDSLFVDDQKLNDRGLQVVRPTRFDVPIETIYDRMSDGKYVAKYENYNGATGNEERLAQQQSTGEKAWNGIIKNTKKTLNYALDSTVGTAYGLVNALSSGRGSDLYDNDFGNWMDDVNKKLDYKLPNYYTDEEKSKNFLQSMGTANFWANDFLGGVAFVGGALIPSIAMAAVTGGGAGAGLVTNIGKAFGKRGLVNSLDDIAEAGASITRRVAYGAEAETARRSFKSLLLGSKVANAGNAVKTATFLARSSAFEAGMESRQALKSSIDDYVSSFKEKNGRDVTFDELSSFTKDATSAANSVFAANMAILSVSNAVMYGKTFGFLGKESQGFLKNVSNRAFGTGVRAADEIGTVAVREANKFQKGLFTTKRFLGSAATEGLFEEGLQGVASKTMLNYMDSKYDPKSNSSFDFYSSLHDAFAEQYGTKEGWKEIGLGALIGMGMSAKSILKGSYKNTQAEYANQAEAVNTGVEKLRGLVSSSHAAKIQNGDNITKSEQTLSGLEFIRSQEAIKTPNEIKSDFQKIIQTADFGEDVDTEAYKKTLTESFDSTMKNYLAAKKVTESLKLGERVETTKGNLVNIQDAIVSNFVLGKDALENKKEIAQKITDLTGQDGIHDHLQFYSSLTEEQKQKAEELEVKKQEVVDLTEKARNLGAIAAERGTQKTTTKFNAASEQLVKTNQEILRAQQEAETLEKELDFNFKDATIDLDGTVTTFDKTGSVMSTLGELEKLDTYVSNLRTVGKNEIADHIEDLLTDFKMQTDHHVSSMNLMRSMADTSFFSKKEGKGLLNKLVGKTYEMTPEFREMIKSNEQGIRQSLGEVGIRFEEGLEETLEKEFEQNPDLSDREKFRLEALIRLQMTDDVMKTEVESLTARKPHTSALPTTTPDVLQGDTISLTNSETIDKESLTSVEAINKAIDTLTKSIDYLSNREEKNKGNIEYLKSQLENLKKVREKYAKQLENAVQKSNEQQQASNQQSSSSEYARTETQRETPSSTATSSDSNQSRQREVDTVYDSLEKFNGEVDALINTRIEKYGVPIFDMFRSMSKSMEKTISRAEQGVVTDVTVLRESIDYLHGVYKKLSALKKPSSKQDRLSKNMTINYIVELQSDIEQTLNHLLNYEQAYRTGEPLPKIEYSSTYVSQTVATEPEGESVTGDNTNDQEVISRNESRINAVPPATVKPVVSKDSIKEKSKTETLQKKIEEVDTQIEKGEQQLKDLQKPFRIVDSQGYKRYEELLKKYQNKGLTKKEKAELEKLRKQGGTSKRQKELLNKQRAAGLTDAETEEFETLKRDLDQWSLLTGTIGSGLRLSDLLLQKEVLENTEVEELPEFTEDSAQETMDNIEFEEKTSKNSNYDLSQSYEAATVFVRGAGDAKLFEIAHVSKDTLTELVGEEFETIKDDSGKNNILITEKTVQKINENPNSRISIKPLTKDLQTSYSFVIEFKKDINGVERAVPLQTDIDDFATKMNTDAIYEIEKDDEITFSVDPNDEHNIKLMEAYDSAKGEQKKEARKELKRAAVIRINHNGNFVGVLKANSKAALIKDARDIAFENFRNNLFTGDEMIDQLGGNTEITLNETAKAIRALPGLPNFNLVRNADGTVDIEYRKINDVLVKKIVDFGFIQDGHIQEMKNGTQGIDTTYVSKTINMKSDKKTPIIIFKRGKKLLAYPVRILETGRKADLAEFEAIFNSTATPVQKATNLNKFLAKNGVDIKKPENAFYPTNLTESFFEQTKQKLESTKYFPSVEELMDKSLTLEQAVSDKISINIDLSNPNHSPKVQMDFSFYAPVTPTAQTQESVSQAQNNTVTATNEAQNNVNSQAKEEQETNCFK